MIMNAVSPRLRDQGGAGCLRFHFVSAVSLVLIPKGKHLLVFRLAYTHAPSVLHANMLAAALFTLSLSIVHAIRPPELPIVHRSGTLQRRGVPGNQTGLIQYLSNGNAE